MNKVKETLETTAVYLTADEAEQFVTFQKHRALIGLLQSIGTFDLRNGYVAIHFDRNGCIQSVDKHEYYKELGF